MKKLFTFLSATLVALTMNAQAISVADAIATANVLEDGATGAEDVTVEGFVVDAQDFSWASKQQIFFLADDAANSSNQVFEAYYCAAKENGEAIPVLNGDKVKLTGKLTKYVKEANVTPEIKNGVAEFVSKVEGDRSKPEAASITVAKALELGASIEQGKTGTDTYTIVGYVTAFDGKNTEDGGWAQYKNQIFWIADEKGSTAKSNTEGGFEIYQGVCTEEVHIGDKVSVYTKIKNYNGILESETKAPVTMIEKSEVGGKCGYGGSIAWNLAKGVLTISGKGDMGYWSSENKVPWYKYRTSIKSVVIEDGVTSIGYYAFYNCRNITSVTIPNSVTEIGSYAFYFCSSLTSVTIPNSVIEIGDNTFSWCTSLTSIAIGNGITSIGLETFSNCTALTSVTIPNSVESIGYHSFSGCTALTSVEIPNSVTSIEHNSFTACSSLASVAIDADAIVSKSYSDKNVGMSYIFGSQVKEYIIGNSVTSIGWGAFKECHDLTSVIIGDNVTGIGGEAFSKCSNLTSLIIGESVTNIGYNAFGSCVNLKSITINSDAIISKDYSSSTSLALNFGEQVKEYKIGDKVTGIGKYAFSECSGMTTIEIPNNVSSIGKGAFHNCSNLTSIIIPDGVQSIEESLFSNCNSLESVVIPNSITSIRKHAFWRCSRLISITIPENVTEIEEYTFLECGFSTLTIPNSVTNIGYSAFSECSNLTSIIIGTGVENIGDYAFYRCKRLTSLSFGINVKSIGNYAFSGCSSGLTSVEIPNSVTSIGDYAFSECSVLTSVTLPNSVTSIGSSAFSSCISLNSIIIPINITEIRNSTFSYCSGLTSVTLPKNINKIGERAFFNCEKLVSIEIPDNVTSIESSAFGGCKSLISIEIPNSITKLADGIFYFCKSLTSIDIPNSVLSIGKEAFHNSGLTSIVIPNSVTSIGKDAFLACASMEMVSLGENITEYGDRAFASCPSLKSIYNYRKTPAKLGTDVFKDVDFFNCTLFVLAGSVDMYKSTGSDWKDFYNVLPIGAESVKIEGVVVTPHDNSADFIWPSVSGAALYELKISDKDGNPILTLSFNGSMQLIDIVFHAQARNGAPQQQAETVDGYRFTVTGLDVATNYRYSIIAKDESFKILAEYTGSFGTIGVPEDLQALENVQNVSLQSTKILRNGQIFILRGEKVYSITGQEVR